MGASKELFRADYEWAIMLHRKPLQLLGLWPKVNEDTKRIVTNHFRAFVAFILVMHFLVIPNWWSLVIVRDDLMLVMDNLQVSLSVTSEVLRLLIFYWNKGGLSEAVDEVQNDWLKWKSAKERDTMIKRAHITRKLTSFAYCLVTVIWLMLSLLPYCFGLNMRYITNLTDPGGKALAIQSHFYYDLRKNSNFLLTYTFQGITLLYLCIFYTSIDCFFAFLILHVCGQLENLALHLTNLCDSKNIRAAFSFCVQEHVRLIRFVRIVDNSANIMLLVHLLTFIVLTCFQGFLFIKILKDNDDLPILRFLWLASAIFAVLVHVFLYCLAGEILVMRCEEIYDAAYSNEWYALETNEAKMLILILLRARPPLYITAGKMFPMTMSTFCNVIKTSASYVSVLLAFF